MSWASRQLLLVLLVEVSAEADDRGWGGMLDMQNTYVFWGGIPISEGHCC